VNAHDDSRVKPGDISPERGIAIEPRVLAAVADLEAVLV